MRRKNSSKCMTSLPEKGKTELSRVIANFIDKKYNLAKTLQFVTPVTFLLHQWKTVININSQIYMWSLISFEVWYAYLCESSISKRAHPFLSIGSCMIYVQEINILNGYNCETFDEGCPNASYFSDETYLCKSNKCYLKLIDFCVIKCNFCIHKVKYIYKTLYRSFNWKSVLVFW